MKDTFQRRAASLSRETRESTRSLLNAIPMTAVFVIDRAHRILYMNDMVARLFPEARIGAPCHEAFRGRRTACPFCPVSPDGKRSSLDFGEHSPFAGLAELTVSPVLWDDGEPASIVMLSGQAGQPPDEGREWRMRRTLVAALCDSYRYVLDLEAESGRCTVVAGSGGPATPPEDYDAETARIEEALPADCRMRFRQLFSREALCGPAGETGHAKARYMEYQADFGDGARWYSRLAVPYAQDDGTRHWLHCIRDVSDRKRAESLRRQEEENVRIALQNSYAKIYRMNLAADRLTCLFCNAEILDPCDVTGSYAEDMDRLIAERVHPDDRALCRAFFAASNLLEGLADGKDLSIEYRKLALDGAYRWLLASVVPLPERDGEAILLLRDITPLREEEAVFYKALQESYDEIYEASLDADAIRAVHRDPARLVMPEIDGSFARASRQIAACCIHPEDRQRFLEHYDADNIRRRFRDNSRLTAEYRALAADGRYHWVSSFLLPLPGNGKCLILRQDVEERKAAEQAVLRLERRQGAVLRRSADCIIETNLDTWRFSRSVTSPALPPEPREGDYRAFLGDTLALIHPEDRDGLMRQIGPEALAEAARSRAREIVCRYRIRFDAGYRWLENRTTFLEEADGITAFAIIRDITEEKREERRQRINEQYDRALRNIYDEVYEVNVTRDTCHLVYHVKDKFLIPPEQDGIGPCLDYALQELVYPDDAERLRAFFDIESVRERFRSGTEYLTGEYRKRWANGEYHWVSLTLFPVAQPEGDDEIYLLFIMDIRDRKRAEAIAQQNVLLERRRLDDERYRTIIEQTQTHVFERNLETGARFISPAFIAEFLGDYDERDLADVWREDGVIEPEDLPRLEAFRKGLDACGQTEMTARFRRRDGASVWCRVTSTCLHDAEGRPKRRIGTLNDVDKATRSMLALRYRAEFDLLTGTYNRDTFHAQAEKAVRDHPDRRYSIIRMDIDRFKVVNDLYGTKKGDELLIFIAGLLRAEMADGKGVYGRIGGDVFCLCADLPRDRIEALVGRVTARLADYPLPHRIVPSFGVCEVDSLDTPIDVLCDWANLALETVKGNFLQRYAYYDGTLREKILEEKDIESRMHDALLEGQFVLYLQPKVDIRSSRIIGSEGLVRWLHPAEGLIPPDRFIPLFEKNGFVVRLDEHIWEQACMTLRRWIDQGFTPAPVSVNVSRLHLHDPHLCRKLRELVGRYGLPPRLLELELTESVFLENGSALFDAIRELRSYGFRFLMDDFGSGYSSLNMLKSIPVDFIKLDREFLNEEVATDRGKTVIQFSIALARKMGIEVIAEGVESEEQAAFLLRSGCACAQGYLYARPMPVPDFETLAFRTETPFPLRPRIAALVAAER